MKTIIKLCLPLSLLLLLVACSGGPIKGNGKVATDIRQVASFDSIHASGKLKIALTAGKTQKVAVTADSNLINAIDTKVKDGILYIATKPGITIAPSHGPAITIRLPKLDKITTAGDVHIMGGNIVSKALAVDVNGLTKVELIGQVTNLSIKTSGASNVNTVGLKADVVNVDVNGVGNVHVYAVKSLNVKISGAGNVEYAGNPEVTQNISGIGKLNKIKS